MLAKGLIILSLIAILYALGSSFFLLLRDKGEGKRTVRRLTWRVGLSLLLFLAIIVAMATGWIQPGSGGPVRYPQPVEAESSYPEPSEPEPGTP